jgi:broad specificity phosphatase PhoE
VPQGGKALIVAHQLPIYIARLDAEGRSFVHNPATRECRLASVTSFHFMDGRVAGVEYSEPAADLYPAKKKIFRPGM